MERTESLKQLVRDEAARLREFATVEERGRLDIKKLDWGDSKICFYGLLTGNCFSERARELLNLCAVPFSFTLTEYIEPKHASFRHPNARDFSPIEFYICQRYAKNAELIAYLKGETDTLDL